MNATPREIAIRKVLLIAAVVCLVVIPVILPSFLVYQLSIVLTYAVAILGLNLLMGFNGQISVAQGVFFALGAYSTAIFATKYGFSHLATLPVAVAVSAFVGFLIGIPALRMQGLPMAFMTLGLAVLVPPLALKLDFITNGASGISFLRPTAPTWFPGNDDAFLYETALLGLAVCVWVTHRLLRGDTGRTLRAVRDNALIAESLGVNLTSVRLAAFTTSAAYAGFGGWLFALINGFVSPESFQMQMSFYFLAGAIVGGITSISGALIGALFITFIPEWSSEINLAFSGVIYGACLVGVMLLAPEGAVGLIRSAYAFVRPFVFGGNAVAYAKVREDSAIPGGSSGH